MITSYLALLRGINVGGKNMIKMADLKAALEADGLQAVRTYIQSGNVLFEASNQDDVELAKIIHDSIAMHFQVQSGVAVFSKAQWQDIIGAAPAQWGQDPAWKHNLLVILKPYDMQMVITAIGEIKPDIELLVLGEGVLYQSMSRELFGRTTTGKLASNPVYKQMTIRNYNTAVKLLEIL
jgi:uncharacterized protein (DUF1697 family)